MCVQNGESPLIQKAEAVFCLKKISLGIIVLIVIIQQAGQRANTLAVDLNVPMKQFGVEESDIQRLQLELLKEQDVATLLLKQKNEMNLHI